MTVIFSDHCLVLYLTLQVLYWHLCTDTQALREGLQPFFVELAFQIFVGILVYKNGRANLRTPAAGNERAPR